MHVSEREGLRGGDHHRRKKGARLICDVDACAEFGCDEADEACSAAELEDGAVG